MRPIDADAIKYAAEFISYVDGRMKRDAIVTQDEIDAMPTIEPKAMSDYISKSALLKLIPCEEIAARMAVSQMPTIDAVPVVRCKDCKHYRAGEKLSPQKFCFRLRGRDGEAIGYNFAENGFCSYGERSEDEEQLQGL